MKKAVYICSLFLFIACSSNSVPKGILVPDKMQKIVYEMMQIDEYLNNFVIKDSTINLKNKRSILYEDVFKINNTNRKEFYTSYKYYEQNPDIQKKLFDSIFQQVNRKKIEPPKVVPAKSLNKAKLK